MKRYLIILIIALATLGFVGSVQAAGKSTISFSPETKTVKVGEVFTLKIVVDPQGEFLDTVRAAVKFPQDKLEAIYFALDNLYPNPAPKNFIDQASGLISQGGAVFGGQTAKKGIFGTITFKALQNGEALINLTEDCRLISSGEEKVNLSHLGKAVINIEGLVQGEIKKQDIILSVPSHPDENKWYSNNKAEINWELAEGTKEISSYFYALDQEPQTNPSILYKAEERKMVSSALSDGLWYFHFKAKFKDGTFSEIIHYRLMIDIANPVKIAPVLEKDVITEDESTDLKFGTIDQTSGIDYYEVGLDGGSFQKQSSPYTLNKLSKGEHLIIVRAVDKAGNISLGATRLNVKAGEKKGLLALPLRDYVLVIVVILLIVIIYWLIALKKKNR